MAAVMRRGVLTSRWFWQAARVALPRLASGRSAGCIGDGTVCSFRQKSIYSALPDDYNCKVELALTSDGKTIVCYHPSIDIPYEHTKPIPVQDPLHSHAETHEQVLKARLREADPQPAPTMEQLSKMFYTTKHRWYPIGEYRKRRIKVDPPKDR
uniref:Large ribosomal subunit protein mL42 n=1 Tax=Leptobrachium leishanense TaxID=445787 RepID=A0A8C5WAW3_9ANUR